MLTQFCPKVDLKHQGVAVTPSNVSTKVTSRFILFLYELIPRTQYSILGPSLYILLHKLILNHMVQRKYAFAPFCFVEKLHFVKANTCGRAHWLLAITFYRGTTENHTWLPFPVWIWYVKPSVVKHSQNNPNHHQS